MDEMKNLEAFEKLLRKTPVDAPSANLHRRLMEKASWNTEKRDTSPVFWKWLVIAALATLLGFFLYLSLTTTKAPEMPPDKEIVAVAPGQNILSIRDIGQISRFFFRKQPEFKIPFGTECRQFSVKGEKDEFGMF